MRSPTMPPNAAWTNADVELLRQLASDGVRLAAVALRLGRSYDSVRWRARREGITFPAFRRLQVSAQTLAAEAEPF